MEIQEIREANQERARKRKRVEENKRLVEAELEQRKQVEALRAEDRKHRLKIYISKCNVADKQPPSYEDMQKMLSGEMEIPESA